MIALAGIIYVAVLSGLWIGLAGLWRARQGPAWWLMAAGALMIGLVPVFLGIAWWIMASNVKSYGFAASSMGSTTMIASSVIAIPSGILLFCIGFAIHGKITSRKLARIDELEHLASEMAGEMQRIRPRPPLS